MSILDLVDRLAQLAGDSRQAAEDVVARFDRRRQKELSVTPEFYDLDHEPLTLTTADGVDLAAWFIPAPQVAEQTELMVLMHHHYGGQKAALLPWIALFHELGLSCLAFDARGHAGSPCPADQDSYHQRFGDVRVAFDELLRRGARRVLAFAQSQGGAVVVGALAQRPELAALICDSGPAPTALASVWGLARWLPAERAAGQPLVTGFVAADRFRRIRPGLGYPVYFWRGLWRLRQRPLLWLHGTADEVIPRQWAQLWFDAVRPPGAGWEALAVPGAAHAECLQHGGEVVARRVEQFVEQLRSAGEGACLD